MEDTPTKIFVEIYKLRNLIIEPTCLDSLRHELNIQGQFLNEKKARCIFNYFYRNF